MDIVDFRRFVKRFLAGSESGAREEIETLEDDANLLGTGLVDSFRFIELCLAVEERTGIVIDITEMELDQFSIAGLYQLSTAEDSEEPNTHGCRAI